MAIKNNENVFVTCMECKWSELMQWFENPIVAQCNAKGERQVAATKRLCKEYAVSTEEKTVTHYDKYEDVKQKDEI